MKYSRGQAGIYCYTDIICLLVYNYILCCCVLFLVSWNPYLIPSYQFSAAVLMRLTCGRWHDILFVWCGLKHFEHESESSDRETEKQRQTARQADGCSRIRDLNKVRKEWRERKSALSWWSLVFATFPWTVVNTSVCGLSALCFTKAWWELFFSGTSFE